MFEAGLRGGYSVLHPARDFWDLLLKIRWNNSEYVLSVGTQVNKPGG